MLIKSADISNEVRPPRVAEPWVDNLLEEFFMQHDKELVEGLPPSSFMDRKKVKKSITQSNFIAFVMIPIFEAMSKVLPNMVYLITVILFFFFFFFFIKKFYFIIYYFFFL